MIEVNKKYQSCLEDATSFCALVQDDPMTQLKYPVQYIVNMSLSCELFLKAIAMKRNPNGKYTKTHDFIGLWNNIPEVDRQSIESIYQKDNPPVSLGYFLYQSNSLFVDWRYEFEEEKRKTSITSLDAFVLALKTHSYSI